MEVLSNKRKNFSDKIPISKQLSYCMTEVGIAFYNGGVLGGENGIDNQIR